MTTGHERPSLPSTPRDAEMLRLYRDERLTLAAIGRAYGISTQRVHQCLCRIVGDAPFRTLRAKEVAP